MARARCHALKERVVGFAVRWPVVALAVMQLALAVVLIVFSHEIVIDPDVEAFAYGGTNASLYQSSYRHAWLFSRLAPRKKLQGDSFGLIDGVPSADLFGMLANASAALGGLTYAHFSVHLIYHLSGGGNVLTERTLYAVQQFEERLRSQPLWQELCKAGASSSPQSSAYGGSCDPGESLVGFIWPEPRNGHLTPNSGQRAGLLLSGRGSQWLPVDTVLGVLAAGGESMDRLRRFLPQDFVRPASGAPASADALQSHFLFSLPVGGSSVPGALYATEADARDAFHNLLDQEVHAALDGSELLEKAGVRVFMHGPEVRRFEVELAWQRDCCLVIGSVLAALLVLSLRLKSLALAAFGLLLVMESVPLSFVIFRLITGTPIVSLNLLDLAGLFVVIGLGADAAIFEVFDGWVRGVRLQGAKSDGPSVPSLQSNQTGAGSDSGSSFEEACHTRHMRGCLRCTWASAVPSFPVATACTSSSLFGCLTSRLQSFREVGLLLGLSVISASMLVAAMLPLALVAAETWRFRRRRSLNSGRGADESVPFNVGRLVPDSEAMPDSSFGPEPGGGLNARVQRLLEELWQAWAYSISTLRWWLLGALAVFVLACFVGTLVAARADGVLLGVFGTDHNQAAGLRLRDRFGGFVAAVASSPASQDASYCDVMVSEKAPEWETCRDDDVRCGAWAAIGQCEQSPWFMEARCRRSCGRCSLCLMRHCGVRKPPSPGTGGGGMCECYAGRQGSSFAEVQTTIAGLPPEAWPSVREGLAGLLQGTLMLAQTNGSSFVGAKAWKQPPLVQEHWRSGSFALQTTFQAPALVATSPAPSTASTTSQVNCYCAGVPACKNVGVLLGSFNQSSPPAAARRLASGASGGAPAAGEERPGVRSRSGDAAGAPPGRRLVELDLRHTRREVSVTWGLLVEEPGFLELFPRTEIQDSWKLDGMFEPSDPWVQRSMMAMCSGLAADLRAVPQDAGGQTWLQIFEHWLLQRGEQFPSRDFHRHMEDFLAEQPIHQRNVLTEGGRVRAVRVVLALDVPTTPSVREISELKLAWDRHVEASNRQAGLRARNAWHTSDLWVLLETHDSIVAGTWFSLLVCSVIVVVGALVYTRDAQLTLLCVCMLASALLAQAFFMSVLLQWSFGVVEALALVAFAGHAAVVGLRVAAAYACAPPESPGSDGGLEYDMRPEDGPVGAAAADRYRRTLHALEATGWGILGSAGLMAGTGFFMLLCTLQFHVKFGVAMFSILAFSLLHSLLVLPLLLLIAGPTPHGFQPWSLCHRRLCAWAEQLVGVPALAAVEPFPLDDEPPEPNRETAGGEQRSARRQAGALAGRANGCEPSAEAGRRHQAIATGSCLYINGSSRPRSDPVATSREQREEKTQDGQDASYECIDL